MNPVKNISTKSTPNLLRDGERMNVFLLHPKQVRKFFLISPFLLSTVATSQGSMAGKTKKDLQMRQAQT